MSALGAALLCLSLNAYHEGRGEPFHGQVAVGQVVMRRAAYRPERACREVYREGQFSWTPHHPRGRKPPPGPAWRRAQQAAKVALLWSMGAPLPDYSKGATHYAHRSVRNHWTRAYRVTAEIGGHRFYHAL